MIENGLVMLRNYGDISNANSSRILENLAKICQEAGNGSATKAAHGCRFSGLGASVGAAFL